MGVDWQTVVKFGFKKLYATDCTWYVQNGKSFKKVKRKTFDDDGADDDADPEYCVAHVQ